jgi:hypothetical protein
MGIVAGYFAQAGDVGRTVQWLERAYAVSPIGFDFRVLDSKLFDPVRNDPQFRTAVRSIRGRIRQHIFGT